VVTTTHEAKALRAQEILSVLRTSAVAGWGDLLHGTLRSRALPRRPFSLSCSSKCRGACFDDAEDYTRAVRVTK